MNAEEYAQTHEYIIVSEDDVLLKRAHAAQTIIDCAQLAYEIEGGQEVYSTLIRAARVMGRNAHQALRIIDELYDSIPGTDTDMLLYLTEEAHDAAWHAKIAEKKEIEKILEGEE